MNCDASLRHEELFLKRVLVGLLIYLCVNNNVQNSQVRYTSTFFALKNMSKYNTQNGDNNKININK